MLDSARMNDKDENSKHLVHGLRSFLYIGAESNDYQAWDHPLGMGWENARYTVGTLGM